MTEDDLAIGRRVREQRQVQGISLRELASRTELSAAFISQVELGQVNPSISSLRRIAAALDTPIPYFLEETDPAAAPARVPVMRAGRRPRFNSPDSTVEYELMTPDPDRKMAVICGRVKPGSGNIVRHIQAPTEEWVYVLSGNLRVRLDSDEHVLSPGDCIYFEGRQLEALECASEAEDAVWISAITPSAFFGPGDR